MAHTSDGALVPSRAVFGARSDFESADVFPAPVRTGLGTVRPALPPLPCLMVYLALGALVCSLPSTTEAQSPCDGFS